ncbi:MAG: NlpC/P60 family protein [Acidobacteriia bacterium]|nr:NlpC/P60 family protein [Terriglobia bacterium]
MMKSSGFVLWTALTLVGCVAGASGIAATNSGRQSARAASRVPHHSIYSSKAKNPAAGTTHVVRSGDTLYEMARSYHTTVAELKKLNHLQSTRLKIGQRIRIREDRPQDVLTAKSKRPEKAFSEPFEPAPKSSRPQEIEKASTEAQAAGQPTLRNQLVEAGIDLLGVPYRRRGMSEERGFDCSGLVKTLFDKFSIEVPRSAREQFKFGEKVARAELEIGDLVFFSSRGKIPNHVGVYIGDNQFLHAALHAHQVIISNLEQAWYQKRFIGARRIGELWNDEQKPQVAKGN